ncbi:unnamed protein product [Peniophora sp. CBMAI 1063]|nr:unnamed protein product [Peniophora sp. CBMAI 1063]
MSEQDVATYRRTGLLDLPIELLSDISSLLSHQGILRLASTCRRLQETYKASKALRYIVELGAAGLVDGSHTCPLTLSERRGVFHARRAAWRKFQPERQTMAEFPDVWLAFDLAGGVYAHYTISRSPQLVLHWLPSRAFEERRVEVDKMDILVKDLAMDPSQDLIVFLEGHSLPHGAIFDDEPVGTDISGNLRLHLRSLQSQGQAPHELAAGSGTLNDVCPVHWAEVIEVFLVNDILAVFIGQERPVLRIWNWKSGRLLVSLDPEDFVAEQFMTAHFAFISDRAFVLTKTGSEARGPISIHLIALNHCTSSTHGRTLLRDSVRLFLPRPHYDRRVPYILTKTGSFALPEPARQIHNAAPTSRMHIFLIQAQHDAFPLSNAPDVAVMVAVKTSTLIRLLDRPSEAPRELPWITWGPGNTRIVEHGEADGLSERAVFGSRVVFSTQYAEAPMTTEPWVHFLLDFHIPTCPDDDGVEVPHEDSLAERTQLVGCAERTFDLGLRPEGPWWWTAEDHTVDQLPCLCTRLRTTSFGLGDEVLMDDERFIRRRTFPDSEMEQTTTFRF